MKKIVDSLFDGLIVENRWWKCYYLRRKLSNFAYTIRKIGQRLRHGFPDHQVFEFFSWHAKTVVPRLKRLRDTTNSHPDGLDIDGWRDILSRMIWSFEHVDDLIEPIYSDDYDHRFTMEEMPNGNISYEPMNKTGTVDYGPVYEHNQKVQDGLELFARYYRKLWN